MGKFEFSAKKKLEVAIINRDDKEENAFGLLEMHYCA